MRPGIAAGLSMRAAGQAAARCARCAATMHGTQAQPPRSVSSVIRPIGVPVLIWWPPRRQAEARLALRTRRAMIMLPSVRCANTQS